MSGQGTGWAVAHQLAAQAAIAVGMRRRSTMRGARVSVMGTLRVVFFR